MDRGTPPQKKKKVIITNFPLFYQFLKTWDSVRFWQGITDPPWHCTKHIDVYCTVWCCLGFWLHDIVGLMTLALDSMIEPSQSQAYPEPSTILRSIVYSSSKLQGKSEGCIRFAGISWCILRLALKGVGYKLKYGWGVHSVSTSMWKSSNYFCQVIPTIMPLVGLKSVCLFTFPLSLRHCLSVSWLKIAI